MAKVNSFSYLDRRDKRISWVLMWSFIATTLNFVIKTVFPLSGSLWNALSIATGGSILAAYLLCLRIVCRRAIKPLLLSFAAFALIYTISCFLCSVRGEPINLVLESARTSYLLYLPAGVLAISVSDKRILYDVMLKASLVLSALLLFKQFAFYNSLYGQETETDYSMSFGYRIIVPTILQLNEFFRSKKKGYLFLALIEIICIILYANRGVLLSLFAFLLYESLIGLRKTTAKLLVISILFGLFIVFFEFGDVIFDRVINTLNNIGIKSRTLWMLANDSIDSDSGRLSLIKIAGDMIAEKPVLGWGVGGECYHFNLFLHNDVASISCTPHNGIVQAMVQLGVVPGIALSILVVIPILNAHRIQDQSLREIIVVYFCAYGVTCLTVSSGFLVQPEIAIFLFLYYSAKRDVKQR